MNVISDASALAGWRKSSYSDNGAGGCVEVSDVYPASVPVRDSKVPHGPALVSSPLAGLCSSLPSRAESWPPKLTAEWPAGAEALDLIRAYLREYKDERDS